MKQYLGDAVYCEPDGHGGVILTTEDGYRATNTIYLEPEVIRRLLQVEEVRDQLPQAVRP